MKEKIEKYIDNVFMVLLMFILIASSLLIRRNEYYYIMKVTILVLSILYILIRNIEKKPIKIIKNKLDLLVLILTITSFVPLIFNTYVSLKTTIITGLNYISLYFLYLLVREIFFRKNAGIKYLNILIIVQAILFVILGIEDLTTNNILSFFGIKNTINGESRLVSIFGNPNILASYLLFSFCLILHKVINEENLKKKVILNICNTICLIGILLSYSKSIYVITLVMVIIYMIYNKNKGKNVEIIQNIITYGIISGIYINLFNKIILIERYALIWIFLMILIILEVLINILNIKIKKKLKSQYIIGVLAIVTICAIIWIMIELQNTIPYSIFNNNNTIDYSAKKLDDIKANTQYKITFDLQAKAYSKDNTEIDDMYEINVIERDKQNKEIKNESIVFGNYDGIKEIEIFTHEKTRELKIEFKAKFKYINRELTINELKLNGNIIPLQYKNISIKLVDKIKDININYKTIQERFQFIKDAIKLSKDNLLTGIGGEGWQYKYGEAQEYDYTSLDIHSYPTQILLEFGIFGLIALCLIYIYIITLKIDNKYLGIKFALIVIILHSAIDSEMKIIYIQILVFTYLAILSSLKIKYKDEKKLISIISNIFHIIIAVAGIYMLLNSSIYRVEDKLKGYEENSIKSKQDYSQISEIYEKIIKYERINEMYYYTKFLEAYINSGQTDKIEEYYIKIKQYNNKWKQNNKKIFEKSNSIVTIIKALEKQKNPKLYDYSMKFVEIYQNEIDSVKKELETAINNKYEIKEKSLEYNYLIAYDKYIKSIYEKHILGVQLINTSSKDITKDLLNGDIQLENENILLYHTHGTEAFESNSKYEEIDYRKTFDENYNIISVGNILENHLKEKGHNVVHLKDYNDYNGIDGAYDNSEIKVKEQLQKEKADIIFDIHRDSLPVGTSNSSKLEIDGQNVASIRFIIASGHDGWEENLKWAVEIQKKADELYPELFEPMFIYDNNYNQNLGKYATLIEVGDDTNTVEEAQRSMIYLANVLNAVI